MSAVGGVGLLRPKAHRQGVGLRRCRCQRAVVVRSLPESDVKQADKKAPDAKSTIAGIDALLGIEEEKKPEETPPPELSISAQAINQLSNADGMSASTLDSLIRIVGAAKDLDSSKPARNAVDGALREEVDRVTRSLTLNDAVPADDLKVIKKEILGPTSFWVTEAAFLEGDLAGGVLLRGNLRMPSAQDAFKLLCDGCAERFGNQYTVYMVADTAADDSGAPSDKPRVAFQILPTPLASPAVAAGWSTFAAIVLLLLTLGSTMSLSVLAALPKLPVETLQWLGNAGEGTDLSGVVPGIDAGYDPIPFVSVVTTMFLSISGVNFAHETGHRIAAFFRKVKLGAALFVPNGSLGTFGSVTMTQSLIKDRSSMWDVAAAGPLLGLAVGTAVFVYGLLVSTDPSTDPALLIPVPTFLFQGSIALGSVAQAVLGDGVNGKVQVHPAVIAGWCTLFTQALNLLPVGSLDGGRLTQSAFGRQALDLTAVLSYMGLALGVIGSTLSLPFGLFVLFAQRQPERYIQDQISEVGKTRETLTTALIFIALLILIPFVPDSADIMDVLPSVMLQSSSLSV